MFNQAQSVVLKIEEYESLGIQLNEDISECDILLGVKEVQISDFVADKKYFIFSHTIKKQEYNRKLLQTVLNKNIQLIDYEILTDKKGFQNYWFWPFCRIGWSI